MSQAEPRVIDAIADAPIALPNDPALFTADYERAGDDLILATADGARTVVRSYFDADAPQDLVIGGAVVPGRVVGKLARVASADAGAEIGADLGLEPARPAAAPAEGAARPAADLVAEVTETDGRAFIQRADGAREPAVEGAKIYRDDTVITEAESAVGVTFVDGMSFSLSDEGRVLIDEFHYNPEAGEGGGLLSVLQGKFSFVSGGAAHTKPDALMIETPTMTIGVRGTKVVADVGQEGELSQIGLLAEEDGTVGKIAVFTDAGEQIVDVANQVVQVSSRFEPPSAPETRATSDIVETFADALDVLPAPEAFFEPRPEPPAPAAATGVESGAGAAGGDGAAAAAAAGDAAGEDGASDPDAAAEASEAAAAGEAAEGDATDAAAEDGEGGEDEGEGEDDEGEDDEDQDDESAAESDEETLEADAEADEEALADDEALAAAQSEAETEGVDAVAAEIDAALSGAGGGGSTLDALREPADADFAAPSSPRAEASERTAAAASSTPDFGPARESAPAQLDAAFAPPETDAAVISGSDVVAAAVESAVEEALSEIETRAEVRQEAIEEAVEVAQEAQEASLEAAAAAAAAAANAAPEALAPVGLDFRDTKGFISGGPEIGEALAAAGGYTIEAWFHHDPAASEAPQTIFSNSGRGDAPSFYADVMGGELLIAVSGADGDGTAFLGEVSVAAGWNHVALVVAQGDPDDVSAYLNGSTTGLLDIEAQNVSLFFDAPLEGFLIGARSLDKGTSWHSEGAVADVRVWDVARTGDEIRDAIAQPPAADAPGLVASFALEETPDALYRASFETGEDLSSVVLTERLDIGLPGVSEVIGGAEVASGSLFLYGQPDGAATFDVGDLSAVEAATLEIVLGAPSDLADFNEGGGDRFLVEVSVDGGDFVALEAFDFFEGKGFVGETTGQLFGASGGTVLFDLPTGGASVAVRLTADVTSSLEFFEVEEVAVLENVRVGDGVSAAVVGGAQVLDFSMLVAERGETVHGLLSGRDPEGAPISFELVEGPGNGTLSLDEDTGAFTYTAADGFSGDDSFSYQISDGAGLSSVQTVSLSVA